jgi:hypothetical protein
LTALNREEIEEREFYKDIVALAETLLAELDREAAPADTDDFRAARGKALSWRRHRRSRSPT